MSEISKAYEPQSVEDKWYDFWLKHGCFTADPARVSEKRPAYSIVIPPPNVTGMLHMGHVLNNTIQDILSRKARMDGKEVLWLPGTDHAGIATQVQVEKALKKEERLTKYDLGREKFLERVWQWKEKHGGIIINQLKKLGCSCDWTRERFTMDPEYSRCVQKVFVELYKKGLIYRGKRMVNWCPASLTALSDEEVEMESQKGFLYYFKVQVVEQASSLFGVGVEAQNPGRDALSANRQDACSTTWLTVATTRPETIPGDTAIAVNPKDPRYAKFIGKHAIRPLPSELPVGKKLIPIIGDEYVDFEFGTGVLKVTPAHDKNDFEIGQRHKLAAVDIMNPNGSMNDLAGKDMAGLDRFAARKVAVEKLKALGALEKEEPYENKIGFSQRARVPIEPRLSEQWFLKYPAVEQSKACVEQEVDSVGRASSRAESSDAKAGSSGASPHQKMRFHPQRWAKVYDHWLTNIQDWCISRQLWWGHRIPVWSIEIEGSSFRSNFSLSAFIEGNCQKADRLPPDGKWELTEDGPKRPLPSKMSGSWMVESDSSEKIKMVVHMLETEKPGIFQLRVLTDVYPSHIDDSVAATLRGMGLTQCPDVLDTWFSSWLWPFATMGWPEQTETLKKFYPTTDLVTGPDIIFFWVARMIMAGYEFMGEMPFRNVYFTGIIRDKQGRKMSKTLGNSPDPLVLIAQYGADALRFGTMRSAPLGQDVLFDEKDVELGRNFCNKLWNACRFRQMQRAAGVPPADRISPDSQKSQQDAGNTFEVQGEINRKLLTTEDKWILLKLNQAIREITNAFAEYKFNEATATLYRFFWSEYCDWYVEASKAVLSGSSRRESAQTPAGGGEGQSGLTSAATEREEARRMNKLAVIDFVLSHTLRLFHPFLPFITEELWHGMGYAEDMPADQGGKTIMNAPWPKAFDEDFRGHYGLDDCYLDFAQAKFDLVTEGRNLRRIGNVPAGRNVKYIFKPANQVLPHDVEVIKLLLNAEALEIVAEYQPKKGTPTARTPLGELFLPLEGLVDVEAEKARLKKEIEKYEAEITKVEQKLANPAFVQKVPPQVLLEHQQRLADWQAKLKHAKDALEALGS